MAFLAIIALKYDPFGSKSHVAGRDNPQLTALQLMIDHQVKINSKQCYATLHPAMSVRRSVGWLVPFSGSGPKGDEVL